MATINYGENGSALGAKQQAYLDKLMTTEVAQQTIFDRFATVQKVMPLNQGQTIKFRKNIAMKDLVFANEIYKKYTENNVDEAGEGIATLVGKDQYKDFILSEGSSGNEVGSMKIVEFETDVFAIGSYMTITEEVGLFSDMYSLSDQVQQYSQVASLIIDGFYRDLYSNSAGHQEDITGNSDPDDKVSSSAFTKAVKTVSLQLRLSGAKYVNEILKPSANYAKEGLWSKYIGICNTMMAEAMLENPDFRPVEDYPAGVKLLDNEVGMIKDIRIIANENAPLSYDSGNDLYTGEVIIMGKDHTANIPLRGKKRIEVIAKGLGVNGDDPLNRVSTLGWKSWLGAYTVSPERLAKITANFKI
jgi:N4-gp56 family major capsid protein